MYSVAGFGDMIGDGVRMDAYIRALQKCIRPGSVVLDLGTGTGILAMLACKCGARKAYAIDTSDAVQIAVEAARANGFSDRVVVIQRRSSEVTLPERVDAIVSDLHGVLPQFQRGLADLVDARDRFLAPGGALVPCLDSLWTGVVELPERHAKMLAPWISEPLGLDLTTGARYVQNAWVKVRATASELLTSPSRWGTLDYSSMATPHQQGSSDLRAARSGVGHGLVVWFDAELVEGIGFSNAPGKPDTIYGQAFFPWPEGVALSEGDVVSCQIRADLVGEDYVWTWNSEIRPKAGTDPVIHFRQSTFLGGPITKETLSRRSPSRSPGLGEEGVIVRSALERMASGASLDELARELHRHHPSRFNSRQDALDFACDLSSKYGR